MSANCLEKKEILMRKELLLVLFLLFKIAVFNVSSEEFIETATIHTPERTYQIEYLYDADKVQFGYCKRAQNGTAWNNVEYVAWEYDEDKRKTLETTEVWKTNKWVLAQEISFTYDNEGNKTGELLQVVSESVLRNSTRTQWTYDGTQIGQVSVEKWENNMWTLQSLSEYIYNSDGRVAEVIFRDKTRTIIWRKVFAYNEAGLLLAQTLQTKTEGVDPEAFDNESRDVFMYDEKGREILKISQTWNGEEWRNIHRSTSEYDEEFGDLTIQTFENFHSQSWHNVTQTKYFYDGAGNLAEKQFRSWIFEMWVEIFNENYTYNDNKDTQVAEFNRLFFAGTSAPQVASFLPLSYNNSDVVDSPSTTDLILAHKIEVVHVAAKDLKVSEQIPPLPTTDINSAQINVWVYPNPSSDGYFYFNSREVNLLSYEIYDMFGRLIVARSKNDGYLDLHHAPSGIYNALLHTDAGKTVKKLIRK